jgi:hypothetical protein
MSAAQKNSGQQGAPQRENTTPEKLDVPLRVHARVWLFMVFLSVSPVLYILGTREDLGLGDWLGVGIAVVMIQALFCIAQRRCASENLTYWEGLLIAAAAMETGSYLVSMTLSFFLLLYTVAASFVFALLHDAKNARRYAPICFGRLIIAIHKRRLY